MVQGANRREPRVVEELGSSLATAAVDALGGVVVGGNAGEEAVIERLEVDGRPRWRWLSEVGRAARVEALAATEGDIVAVGTFRDRVRIGFVTLESAGATDCFVARLDGVRGFVKNVARFGGVGDDLCRALVVTSTGVCVAGSFEQTMTIAHTTLTSRGSHDIFVASLSHDFAPAWTQQLGGRGNDLARGLATNGDGQTIVVGQFSGEVSANDGAMAVAGRTLRSAGDFDAVVIALDRDGRASWSQAFGGSGFDVAKSAVFAGGDLYVVGSLQGDVPLDAGAPAIASGHLEAFIARFSAGGERRWLRRFPTVTSLHALAVESPRRLIAVGHFKGAGDLGRHCRVESAGGSDVLMATINADGDCVDVERAGGPMDDYGYAVALSRSAIVVGGQVAAHGFVATAPAH